MSRRNTQIFWKLRRLWRGGQPRVIDLFSGCGGFSLGFFDAGCEIIGAVESDPLAIETHARNFFPPLLAPYHATPHDITELQPLSFVSTLREGADPGLAVDIIIGGPPCQAYSRVGRAKLREIAQHPEAHINDPRSGLYLRYLDFVRELCPLAVVMENVTDIMGFNGRSIPDEICETLSDVGYECRYTMLNAVHYGVPQLRERLFIIGLAKELRTVPGFPAPSHHFELPRGYVDLRKRASSHVPEGSSHFVEPAASASSLLPAITAREALGDLGPIQDHLDGRERIGPERMMDEHAYRTDLKPSPYALLMRQWNGFESPGTVQAHTIRYLPRDYRIFRGMKPGDQYPEAHTLATALFVEELQRRRDAGEVIVEGSPECEALHKEFVPCYDPGKFPNKWRKTEPDQPSRTLTAHLSRDCYSHIHYDSEQARVISVREAARLQSFPDGFRFECSMNGGLKQIGNAVPPLMSLALATNLLSTLRKAMNRIPLHLDEDIPTRKHLAVFRPRARLVSILGDQLISDPAVGLIELVKNSYDADATRVRVELTGLGEPEGTRIVLHDDGCGMTLDDLVQKWLSPAVSHKEVRKRLLQRSGLGRVPIGEKGVGRFAAHKLGHSLELVTRASGHPEAILRVDWDDFDAAEDYLDGVEVEVETREPLLFPGEASGTQLTMTRARSRWNRKQLNKVHRALRRLQSPVRAEHASFEVTLRCPDYPELENIDPAEFLDRSHYVFRARVDDAGVCNFEYVCRHPELDGRSRQGSENLVPLAAEELQASNPACGAFSFDVHVWQRTREHLRLSGVSPHELDAMCGVSLYRDGLRVYPYGEPGNDWLYLDQERIQAPSEKLGNNQIVGVIHIDQAGNPNLRDKTNREGLIENEAFLDLRALVRACIRLFSSFWRQDRPGQAKTVIPPPVTCQETARSIASSIKRSLDGNGRVKIPAKFASTLEAASASSTNGSTHVELSHQEAMAELVRQLEEVENLLRERKSKIELLQELAATGLAAERVVNQFGRHVSTAVDALKGLKALFNGHRPQEFDALEFAVKSLVEEFRALAPYGGSGRRESVRKLGVREVAQIALNINRERLRKANITWTLEGQDFEIQARPSAFLQVLDNLIDNARYWTSTIEGERRVGIQLCELNRSIVVADTGPGIPPELGDAIFDPFVTLRSNGRGLGLHLVKDLLGNMGGEIEVTTGSLVPVWATGAVFVLSFRSKVLYTRDSREPTMEFAPSQARRKARMW